jgi:hypothetical protein
MITSRTWPYGTVKSVRVVHVEESPLWRMITCIEDATREGFVLVTDPICTPSPLIDDHGTITFHRGGSTGGYWHYVPNDIQQDSP